MLGSAFADRLTGTAAANLLNGGSGDDTLLGGGGADTLIGQVGADLMNGGPGRDLASYAASNLGVTINLARGIGGGGAAGDRFGAVEDLLGSASGDVLIGSPGSNRLNGGRGDDIVIGGSGNDTVAGQVGEDRLFGGPGVDGFLFGRGDGNDSAEDFRDDLDTLLLDDALWSGRLTPAQVLTEFATQNGVSGVAFDFGDGDVLRVNSPGLTVGQLLDDILIV